MDSILQAFDRYGAAPALLSSTEAVSYAELARQCDAFASGLPATRSLIFLEARNDVPTVIAYLACLRAGHVVHLHADQSEAQLAGLVERYRPNLLIEAGAQGPEVSPIHDERIALHPELQVLLSTSGSTGSPKFVKLSKANLESNARAIAEYLGLSADDRAVTGLKFNYSYGMSVIHSHLVVGASLWVADVSVTDQRFWQILSSGGCTSFAGVPYSFEMLAESDAWAATPGLRYVTQAGGRLAPALVVHMATLAKRHGWKFFVMYGQTEAAPRIAYLPPELALDHPDCIGRAIPGGELFLIDENGHRLPDADEPAELAYAGPNVMMGYALGADDLLADETPEFLKTGDIATVTEGGLFRIVGRAARIVKPFGIRVNLDELQEQARALAPGCAIAGTDDRIIVALPADAVPPEDLLERIAQLSRLPSHMIQLVSVESIPLLPTGKIDYRSISEMAPAGDVAMRDLTLGNAVKIVASRRFFGRVVHEAAVILGLAKPDWPDVRTIFKIIAGAADVRDDSRFSDLGDSLSYVQTGIALEDYLGFLPDNWNAMTVEELEGLRTDPALI